MTEPTETNITELFPHEQLETPAVTAVSESGDTKDTPIETDIAGNAKASDKTENTMDDYISQIFGSDAKKDTKKNEKPDGEPSEEPSDKPTGEEDDTEQEEDKAEGDKPKADSNKEDPTIVKLKDKDFEKEVDLKTEEGYAYVIQHAQKGLNYERKMQEHKRAVEEVELQKASISDIANTLAYNELYLQSQGKFSEDVLTELPYENFIGKGEDEREDVKLWNQHNNVVKENLKRLTTFETKYKESSQSLAKIITKFKETHPEIENPVDWIKDNVAPYHLPTITFGAVAHPEDALEMVYFWKNKDKILSAVREKAIKEYVNKTPKTEGSSPRARAAEGMKGSAKTSPGALFGDKRSLVS